MSSPDTLRLFGCARVAGLAGLITSPAVRQPAGEPAAPAPPLSHRDSRAQQEQCVQPAGTVRQPSQRFSSQPNRTAAIGALTQLVGLEQLICSLSIVPSEVCWNLLERRLAHCMRRRLRRPR